MELAACNVKRKATDLKRLCDGPESINPNIDTQSYSCTCNICNCSCNIYFKGDEFVKIAEQSQLAKEQEKESAANDKKKSKCFIQ